MTLATAEYGVGNYIQAFVAANDPAAAADLILKHMAALREDERDADDQRRHGTMFTSRMDRVLDSIEYVLLPVSPQAAYGLLVLFIESDTYFADHAFGDDLGLGTACERACSLLITASKAVPASTVKSTLQRLVDRDNCGLRSALATHFATSQ